MKILVNALSGNGDALMFSPSLKLLKQKLPDARIDMLVMFKSVKELYLNSPYLDNVYFINFLNQSKLKSLKEVRIIKKNDYDYSLNIYPSNRLEYNLVNSFLGAKTKISHHYIHTDLFRGEFLNDILVNEIKDRHNVLQNADLVKCITELTDEDVQGMEIYIGDSHADKAKSWIDQINPDKKLLAGMHPGSALLKNHVHKRWDKNKFAEVGNYLIKNHNAAILLFGNEFELNEEIKNKLDGNAHLASTPDFMDSAARMKHCGLFITNDTAFLHCAAALKIPTVAIFGYTNYKELYPWKTPHAIVRKNLDCSPCFYNSPKPAACKYITPDDFKCMKNIEPNEVISAVESLKNYFSL